MANKKRRQGFPYLIVIILVGLLVFLYYKWDIKDMKIEYEEDTLGFVSTDFNLKYDYNSSPDIYYTGSGFYFATVDGIKYFDNNGKMLWDFPLSFNDPKMVGEGNYALVSESKGKHGYMFSEKGIAYNLNYDEQILSLALNGNAYSGIMLNNNDEGYLINVYNEKGDIIYQPKIEEDYIYPLSFDISEDGRILAVSYLNTKGIKMSSNISFYYTKSKDGESFADSMFASSESFEDQLISKIKAVGEDKFVFIGDSIIGVMETESDTYLKTLWTKEMDNQIGQISVSDKYLIVSLGKELINKSGYKEDTVIFMDLKTGETVYEYKPEGKTTYLWAKDDKIVIGGGVQGRKFIGLNENRDTLWEYQSGGDDSKIIILDKNNKILLVTSSGADILEQKKIKVEKEIIEEDKKENKLEKPDEIPIGENINLPENLEKPEENPESQETEEKPEEKPETTEKPGTP